MGGKEREKFRIRKRIYLFIYFFWKSSMCEDLPGGGAPADRRRSAAAVATATVAMATSPRFDTAAEWIIDATPLVPAATARCQGIRRHLNYKENVGN